MSTTQPNAGDDWTPNYAPWRHGGWYVTNIRHPKGGCGCVSRNYADRKWRIVCDPRPFDQAPTFPNRDAAARAEREIALNPITLLWRIRSTDHTFYVTGEDRDEARDKAAEMFGGVSDGLETSLMCEAPWTRQGLDNSQGKAA